MTISLQDALERAELMADDNGLLSQQSYELLTSKLEDEDFHAFTMALLDFGLSVKTGSVEDSIAFREAVSMDRRADIVQEQVETIDYLSRMCRVAQGLIQSPGGLWVPEEYGETEYELDESDIEYLSEDAGEYDPSQYKRIRETLESAGLSVTGDGKVYFYQSNIPGLYTQKLPQTMDLKQTLDYFDRVLEMTYKQQTQVDGLLNSLSKLTTHIYELERLLEELNSFKFSTKSKNPQIRDIGLGIEAVQQYILTGDWNGVQSALDELKYLVDQYYGKQYEEYERLLNIVDALDSLNVLYLNSPEAFSGATQGLGAVARRGGRGQQCIDVVVSV